jgi:ribosomal 50S subunit-recycling heat shock protein
MPPAGGCPVGMRLDKFLQVSRLVKRRALANQLCDGGHVHRSGRPARASAAVTAGDVLQIDYGWRRLTVRVLDVPAGQVGRIGAVGLYEVVADERRAQEPPDAGN